MYSLKNHNDILLKLRRRTVLNWIWLKIRWHSFLFFLNRFLSKGKKHLSRGLQLWTTSIKSVTKPYSMPLDSNSLTFFYLENRTIIYYSVIILLWISLIGNSLLCTLHPSVTIFLADVILARSKTPSREICR